MIKENGGYQFREDLEHFLGFVRLLFFASILQNKFVQSLNHRRTKEMDKISSNNFINIQIESEL